MRASLTNPFRRLGPAAVALALTAGCGGGDGEAGEPTTPAEEAAVADACTAFDGSVLRPVTAIEDTGADEEAVLGGLQRLGEDGPEDVREEAGWLAEVWEGGTVQGVSGVGDVDDAIDHLYAWAAATCPHDGIVWGCDPETGPGHGGRASAGTSDELVDAVEVDDADPVEVDTSSDRAVAWVGDDDIAVHLLTMDEGDGWVVDTEVGCDVETGDEDFVKVGEG